MSRGKYAGQPLSFRCRGCKRRDSRVELTGETKIVRTGKHDLHRWGAESLRYKCTCGHIGWSRHPFLKRHLAKAKESS